MESIRDKYAINCPSCDGNGAIQVGQIHRVCEKCSGTGVLLTEEGKGVERVVRALLQDEKFARYAKYSLDKI